MRLAPLALACAACAARPPAPPSDPAHIPGTSDEAVAAVPEPAPIEAVDPPRVRPAGAPRGTLASGPDGDLGRLKARPHAPRSAARAAPGTHPLGIGNDRDGEVFLPAGYDPRRPAPMIVLLHGATGNAERILRKFRDRADALGIILVIPESRAVTWDLVIQHHFGPDVGFIDRAIDLAFDRYNIDPGRVAVAGFSDGASYALSLGLTNGDLFGAILAFSPGFAAPGTVTGQPRVFVSHGNDDRVLPIERASRKMVRILEDTGYDVRFKEFEGGHEMPDFVLDAAFSWLTTGRG